MPESQLFEAVANLILQSISVWEDMHMYAMAYSAEYNAFWGLLDENLKSTVCRYRKKNREERLVPFTMSHIEYYKNIMTRESFERIRGQHWKKQLKTILLDSKFRTAMTNLNDEFKGRKKGLRYLERRAAAAGILTGGSLRITPSAVCINARVLYNYV